MNQDLVPTRLKRVRKNAGMGLRQMARALEMPPSSYGHYEDPGRFKDPYLPMEIAIRIADILEKKGVDRSVILALAGGGAPVDATTIDARIQGLREHRQKTLLDLLTDLEAVEAIEKARREEGPDSEAKEP